MLRQRLIERILRQSAHNGNLGSSLLSRGLSEQRGNPIRFLSQLGLTSLQRPVDYQDVSRNMRQLLSSSEQHNFDPIMDDYTEKISSRLQMKKGNLHAEMLKLPQGKDLSAVLQRPIESASDSKVGTQQAQYIFAAAQESVLAKSPAEEISAQVAKVEHDTSNVEFSTINDHDLANREIKTLSLPQDETLIASLSGKRRVRIEEGSHPTTKSKWESISAKASELEESSEVQTLELPTSPNGEPTDNTSLLQSTPERTPAEWAELLFAATGDPEPKSEYSSEVQQEQVSASKPFHELTPAEIARRLFALTEASSEPSDVYNNKKQNAVPLVRSLARSNIIAANKEQFNKEELRFIPALTASQYPLVPEKSKFATPEVTRFLKPLPEVDLNNTPLYQGKIIKQLTTNQHADTLKEDPSTTTISRPIVMDEKPLVQKAEASAVAVAKQVKTPSDIEFAQQESLGKIPHPLEPLPDFLAISEPAVGQISSSETMGTAAVSSASFDTTASAQGAKQGQIVYEEPPAQLSQSLLSNVSLTSKQRSTANVAPDLDALARQVYSRLKRRLMAEHRREL